MPERVRWRLLLDAVATLGSGLSLDEVLSRITEIAADLVGARYAALGVLGDEQDQRLRTFITHGIDEAGADRIGDLPSGLGVLGVLIDHPVPLRLPDITGHAQSHGFPANHPPMHAFLGVPVCTGGVVFGNLYLTEKHDGSQFTEADEEIVTALAAAAGVVIESVRSRAKHEELLVFADRERIGRDLHDVVIQRLFAIGLRLQSGYRREPEGPLRDLLDETVDQLDQTIREIRRTIFELSTEPSAGDVQSQITAVIDRAARALKFRPRLHLEGAVRSRIDEALTLDLVAVLNEALSNVHRHAGASEVTITLAVDRDVVLRVRDDGRGIGEHVTESGLANLRARAQARGGSMSLCRPEPGGTTLEWRAPLG
ncbi:GAF domain-containing sensor histidine kinase [Nocardioides sp.]|uniref:GAF domain-containing sensor histidine kinase n=1 Tax=Nocardioides sp. TaxID=35761 RepID=UPI00260FB1AE|nr:GAF domain-containing sensor histidine kinase [Nocardioides sp.]